MNIRNAARGSDPAEPISLPSKKTTPAQTIEELIWLIYGEKKIGKTSLVSQFEDPLFMMFEPGATGLEIYARSPANWKEFRELIKLLESEDHSFKTLVIDTLDKCYESCFKQVMKEEGMSHPSEGAYGAGWDAIKREFNTQIDRILKLGMGVVFIAHATQSEFQKRTGGTYNKLVPQVKKQAGELISGTADVIAYYGYYGDNRYLTISGNEEIECGQRMKHNFWTADGKERIHSIPMFDKDKPNFCEDDAYKNLVRAFNNQQEDRCDPTAEKEDAVLSDVPVKRGNKK